MDEEFGPMFAPEDPGPHVGPGPEPLRCTAESAECTCPEFCERDHANE